MTQGWLQADLSKQGPQQNRRPVRPPLQIWMPSVASSSSLPRVLGQPWRDLVDAAKRYIREFEHEHYPREGDACVYCRQLLREAAGRLLEQYRAYSR